MNVGQMGTGLGIWLAVHGQHLPHLLGDVHRVRTGHQGCVPSGATTGGLHFPEGSFCSCIGHGALNPEHVRPVFHPCPCYPEAPKACACWACLRPSLVHKSNVFSTASDLTWHHGQSARAALTEGQRTEWSHHLHPCDVSVVSKVTQLGRLWGSDLNEQKAICISQLSSTITKYLRLKNSKEKSLPWLTGTEVSVHGSTVSRPGAWQSLML